MVGAWPRFVGRGGAHVRPVPPSPLTSSETLLRSSLFSRPHDRFPPLSWIRPISTQTCCHFLILKKSLRKVLLQLLLLNPQHHITFLKALESFQLLNPEASPSSPSFLVHTHTAARSLLLETLSSLGSDTRLSVLLPRHQLLC